jgi:hypothetical protein
MTSGMAIRALILVLAGLSIVGCGNEIGDDCKTSLDCSQQNNRICDRQQPGGYCTLTGCENSSCPDDAVCVTFRPEPQRLSSTWCMAACDETSDCRDDEGYRCRSAAQLNAIVPDIAAVPYKPKAKFCVVPPDALMSEMPDDAGVDATLQSVPDAAVDAAVDDADSGLPDAAM